MCPENELVSFQGNMAWAWAMRARAGRNMLVRVKVFMRPWTRVTR